MIKWIGQHIISLIARFRSDVYLENIADGTVANDKFLGLDSNNKIVKETVSTGTVDLTSGVTGTLPVGNGGTGLTSISTLLNSNVDHDTLTNFVAEEHYRWDTDISGTATINAANITSLGTLTSGLSIGSATYTGDGVTVTGSASDNTYDVFVGKRKFPRIRLIDDAATGDTEFSIWNLGDELRMGTNPGNSSNAAIVIHTGNAGLVEVQDDIQVNGEIQLGSASDTTIARSAAGVVNIEGNQIVVDKVNNPGSGQNGPIATKIARRTLTTAECNNLHNTPIEIIPAQGANSIILVTGGMVRVDRAANQANASCDFNLHFDGKEPGTFGSSSIAHFRRFHSGATTDGIYNIAGGIFSGRYATTLTEDINKAVEVSFDAAATTDCFTSIDIYLTYCVITQ